MTRAPRQLGGPRRASCVVIERDGRFAAIRSYKHDRRLGLPGGKRLAGETPRETAARECEEEIGVVPRGLEVLQVATLGDFVVTLFTATIGEGEELRSSREGEAVWVTRRDLLLNGVFPKHTAAWLPLYDAKVKKR